MTQTINPRKAAIIGCGFVGSATAFTLMQSRLFSELVLLGRQRLKSRRRGKGYRPRIPFAGQMKIYAGTYDDIADSAIIIITAGANQKPGETRLDLVHKNVAIYKSIIPEISRRTSRYSPHRLQPGRHPDLHGPEALRLPGKPCHRFRHGLRHRPLKICLR